MLFWTLSVVLFCLCNLDYAVGKPLNVVVWHGMGKSPIVFIFNVKSVMVYFIIFFQVIQLPRVELNTSVK